MRLHLKEFLEISNPKLPLLLATDTSPNGIYAVLSHVMTNNMENPICSMSRTLTKQREGITRIIKKHSHYFWFKEFVSIFLL